MASNLSAEERAELLGLPPDDPRGKGKRASQHFYTFDEERKARFLSLLAGGWSMTKAYYGTPVTKATVERHRKTDPEFEKAVLAALEAGIDKLEDAAVERAMNGVARPIYQGGAHVGDVQEYSDSLLAMLLKGKRRNVYGDKHELTGANGAPLIEPPSDRKLAMSILYALGNSLGENSLSELLGPEPAKRIDGKAEEA